MYRALISRVFLRGAMPAAMVALLVSFVAAQNGAPGAQATVQQVVVREAGGAIEVEIQTSVPVAPDTQAIVGPDRIVVDFPGAIPAAGLRTLMVNHGALKGVRSGLFFSNPPITRVVLDLTGPQTYQISSAGNSTIVKLAVAVANEASASTATQEARLRDAALASRSAHLSQADLVQGRVLKARVTPAQISSAHLAPVNAGVSAPDQSISGVQVASGNVEHALNGVNTPGDSISQPALAADVPAQPTAPPVTVTYENGMLSIHADKATLSQVLYEVHLRTQAEIAIPAGAEQEKVVADLGPGPACDVLAQLLNGSAYNFIFVGDEVALQRVILTRKEGSF
ncbi:MAG: AMIN domain-containing protein [Terriglobales bacterium]